MSLSSRLMHPSVWGFRDNPGDIINRSKANDAKGLEVNLGNDISLLGGNVNFNGGTITAPGGKVELGGLSTAGELNFAPDGSLNFTSAIEKANVSLSNQAMVNVRSNNGGAININANNLELTGASLFLAGINSESGFAEAQAGNISITTSNIVARENSQIRNETLGIGNAGNINIATGSLEFTQRSALIGTTFGRGDAGDITIDAAEDISFDLDFGGVHTNIGLTRDDTIVESVVGNAGNININARNFNLTNGARLASKTVGEGNAGDITVSASEKVFIDGEGDTPITRNGNTFVFQSGILTEARPGGVGDAGSIEINAKNLVVDNRALIAADSDTLGDAGDIKINASENVFFGLDTLILTQIQPDGEGDGGDIIINTKNLNLVDSFVLSDSKGRGDAGSIVIKASESILLEDAPDTNVSKFREGSLIISGVGILGDNTEGDAGNIEITTKSLTSEGSSFIVAQTNGIGDGGDIIIQSENEVLLNGSSRIVSQVQENAVGNGGEIRIASPIINLNGLSSISTNTLAGGEGTAGNISLSTSNLTLADNAIVDALTQNSFDGGDITISTNNISMLDGAKIITATNSSGDAGNINLGVTGKINLSGEDLGFSELIEELAQDEILRNDGDDETQANDFYRFATPSGILKVLGGSSGLFANTSVNSTGNSGNISIQNPQEFNLRDTAVISVGSEGTGSAGSLSIQSQSLSLDNGSLLAATPVGVGGNITLSIAENLALKNTSLISSQATENANGGNIGIDANFIIAFPDGNNDILASAQEGQGGNISINAESLFGIQERAANNSTNDINASSDFSLDGSVTIKTPDLNPVQGATELANNVIVPEETSQQACEANRESAAKNRLNITGKSGILPEPGLPLNSLNVTVNGETNPTSVIPQPIETSQGKIQPAKGVIVTESGEIILTAYQINQNGDRRLPKKRTCS